MAALLLAVAPAAGHAAAVVPCHQAVSWTRRSLCADPGLENLYRKLSEARVAARAVTPGRQLARFDVDHRQWWLGLEVCRSRADPGVCLARRLEDRLQGLERARTRAPAEPATSPAGWLARPGDHARAFRACREEAVVPLARILSAWPLAEGAEVGFSLRDRSGDHWICVASQDGHKVSRYAPPGAGEWVLPPGPVLHLGAGEAAPCAGARPLTDTGGLPPGWVSEADC